jgi:hypothetical protein
MAKSMNLSKLEFAGVAVVNYRQIKQIFNITYLREKSLSIQIFPILSVISQPKSALESPICATFT